MSTPFQQINPFNTDIPYCPKCVDSYENKWCCKPNTSFPSDKIIEKWGHVKCALCSGPSSNGYYCDNTDKLGKLHGEYTNPDYLKYMKGMNFYCESCYSLFVLGNV